LPAQSAGCLRDALTPLCRGVPFRNDLVELSLIQRTHVRTIRLSQIVQSTVFNLAPEPSAHNLDAVALHRGRAALVTADPLECVTGDGIDHLTTAQESC
jgi:hypothetical protein